MEKNIEKKLPGKRQKNWQANDQKLKMFLIFYGDFAQFCIFPNAQDCRIWLISPSRTMLSFRLARLTNGALLFNPKQVFITRTKLRK